MNLKMKLFKIINLIFLITFFGFCHANVEDYLKGIEFKRSFSSIEGKVIDFHIFMDDMEYNEMVELSQFSMADLFGRYRGNIPEEIIFNTKVSLNITVDNEVYSYDKVKFKVGGNSSRAYAKIGFNLKLNKDSFLGRNTLRLRSDFIDIAHIRSKLAVDLINKWNIPTVQETYANVYFNDKFFGLYMLLDAIKPNWIRDVYDVPEGEIDTLYNCEGQKLAFNPEIVRAICRNEKEEYLNYTQPLYEMIDEIYEYTTLEQLETKFDHVDNIRKILIMEYLFSASDNFIMAGNNFDFYLKSNGKWEYIPKDFNMVFLLGFDNMLQSIPYQIPRQENLIDYAKVRFEDWHSPDTVKPFIDIFYYQDQETFIKVMKELLITGFNPDEIFARIDELAEFLAPYVERDITPNEDGSLPGRVNVMGISVNYTMNSFWNSLRNDDYNYGFGLKKYFQVKFDSVCELYGIDKTEILTKAELYRKKRSYEIKIYDLNQQVNELTQMMGPLPPVEKRQYQRRIDRLLRDIKSNENSLSKIIIEY